MLFESNLDAEFFKVVHKSANQSYFKVVPLKKGKTTVRSKYVAIVDEVGFRFLEYFSFFNKN